MLWMKMISFEVRKTFDVTDCWNVEPFRRSVGQTKGWTDGQSCHSNAR